MRQMTLVFLLKENKILLGLKKRGFGEDRWNGFGGKVEVDETLEEAAQREVLEECGITITHPEKRAVHTFAQPNNEELEVHTFLVNEWQGEPQETEEMLPRWFSVEDIPWEKMWVDDPYWLPLFLEGKYLRTKFIFDKEDNLVHYDIQEVGKETL